MTKRIGLIAMAGVVIGFSALAAIGDELETVEKKIQTAWAKHKSMTAKMTMVSKMGMGAQTQEVKGDGTIESMRKDGKTFSRMEIKTAVMGMETQSTMIVDGEYSYALTEAMGQRMAMKMDIDPQMTGEPEYMFKETHKSYDLKLTGEETIEKRKAYVIEATPKSTEPQPVSKMVWYFDQESGVLVKNVGYAPDGSVASTMTFTDIKLDVDINPERFVFKLPEGVQLMDQTGQKMPPTAP